MKRKGGMDKWSDNGGRQVREMDVERFGKRNVSGGAR